LLGNLFSEVKTEERQLARTLRREEGASIREIALRVGVSRSSVSHWVRDIELTKQQHDELLRRNPAYNRQRSGVAIHSARRREQRIAADHVDRHREIEKFWLNVAGVPESCLYKSIVNVYSQHSQKKRCNRLPYGTCHVVVSRTRVTQSIYGAIQEYAGFTREAWLE
jgi:transposase-like protein